MARSARFARVRELADALPRARQRVSTSLRREALDRERVLAVAFALLDRAAPRIATERVFGSLGGRGLTPLQRRDAAVVEGVVTLDLPAKGGRQSIDVEDADLAAAVAELAAGRPKSPLLAWERGRRRVALRPAEVEAYVRALAGGDFTAKDFRALHATLTAAAALTRIGVVDGKAERKRAEALAVKATAEALGVSSSVARGTYIDPQIFVRYRDGAVLDVDVEPETALIGLLAA